MPIAVLKYKLPDEQEEFALAQKAGGFSSVLWSLDQEFYRANIKYGLQQDLKQRIVNEVFSKETQDKLAALDQELVDTLIEATLQICRNKLHETCSDYEVSVS